MSSNNPKLLPFVSLILAVLILYYKRPDAFYHAQFWAEEGSVFFSEAYNIGFKSCFNTCNGYFHIYPRLVFNLALLAGSPLEYIPFISCYSWLLIFVVLVIYIWNRIELDPYKKFFLTLTTVVLPLYSEVLMNLTNVQWIMAIFPIIIFSTTDNKKNNRWFWIDFLMIFLTAFTGPNLLVLSPLIFFTTLIKREDIKRNSDRLILLGLIAISLIFTITALTNLGRVSRTIGIFDPLNPAFIEYLYMQYAFLFFGDFIHKTPWLLQLFFTGIIFIFFLFVFNKIRKAEIKSLFSIFVFYAGLLYVGATMYAYRFNPTILDPHIGAMRNFYLPALCFVWFLTSELKAKYKPVLILSLFLVLLFYESAICVGRETLVDLNWNYYSRKVKDSDTLSIPINPVGWHLFINNGSRNK